MQLTLGRQANYIDLYFVINTTYLSVNLVNFSIKYSHLYGQLPRIVIQMNSKSRTTIQLIGI